MCRGARQFTDKGNAKMRERTHVRVKDSFLFLRKGILLLLNCFLGLCMFNDMLKMKFKEINFSTD